jgi:hypothetical protein
VKHLCAYPFNLHGIEAGNITHKPVTVLGSISM